MAALDVFHQETNGYRLCSDIKHDAELTRAKVVLLIAGTLADVIKTQ